MAEEYVFHVVTEKPMVNGQKIILGTGHYNGVHRRVMTCRRMSDVEDLQCEMAEFLKSDLKKWTAVMYRELALEQVRCNEFPDYPSRMACLYTSRTLEEAKRWAEFFQKIGRKVYSVVKLKVDGNIFDGDACNCFDGTEDENDNIKKARNYWNMNVGNENPIMETLVDGEITVVETLDVYAF